MRSMTDVLFGCFDLLETPGQTISSVDTPQTHRVRITELSICFDFVCVNCDAEVNDV
jgi:hypothetical protein